MKIRNNKKIILILIIGLFCIGCNEQVKEQNASESTIKETTNQEEEYIFYTLMFNMPLSFDDLDILEEQLTNDLEKGDVGEIIGDGLPLGEYGPTSTDIEIDVKKSKVDEFKKILENYKFPKKSNLNIAGTIEIEFGELEGIRIVTSTSTNTENLYTNISEELENLYDYKTKIEYSNQTMMYFYGNSNEELEKRINNYINRNKLENISVHKMIIETNAMI